MTRRMVKPGHVPEPEAVPAPRADTVRIPHDAVNEQIVLHAAAVDRGVREKLALRIPLPDFFLVREHQDLWRGLLEIARQKLDYSPDVLRQFSGGKANVEYLEELVEVRGSRPTPNIGHHVDTLEWDRTRVETTKGPLALLLEALREPTTPPERVRTLALQVSTGFDRGSTSALLRDPAALVRSSSAELAERRRQACYPYGLPGLDMETDGQRWRMIPGAAPGKVTVVTGVPGSGKSAFAAHVGLKQYELGRRVLYGAWEMGAEDTLQLLAVMKLGWSRYTLATMEMSDEDIATLEQAKEEIAAGVRFMLPPGDSPIGTHVARGAAAGNARALDQIHSTIADVGADIAIFDLWKRCLRSIDPQDEEQALMRQQAICAETRCHGVILQQQRLKEIEMRQDKRPTREGIKGSGAYVEIADSIIGVHRPALWKPVDDVVLELDVLKQRWGAWPQAIEFEWDGSRALITGGTTVPYDQPISAGGAAAESVGLDTFLGGGGKKKRKG